MKNYIYIVISAFILILTGCNKNSGGNTGVLAADKNDNSSRSEITERYVTQDGSATLVTFKNNNGEKSISISSNKMTIKAPMKSEGVYEDYNYKIVSKGDSLTIIQGNNVIKLEKAGRN